MSPEDQDGEPARPPQPVWERSADLGGEKVRRLKLTGISKNMAPSILLEGLSSRSASLSSSVDRSRDRERDVTREREREREGGERGQKEREREGGVEKTETRGAPSSDYYRYFPEKTEDRGSAQTDH